MKKVLKKIGLALLILFVIIQFFRPAKNINTVDATKVVAAVFTMPDNVGKILQKSCYDCHSNNTAYPWYNNFQPVMWYLNNHVNEGKREINFDEFATYKLRRQFHKMEEIIEQVEEGEMPLYSYTLIHSDAKLSKEDKEVLIAWAKANMDSMKAKYPIDSLIKKK
ncbi:MAG: heme-binding domain-containing protein [Bacteroidetes bacterium]|nr:heme-binding domain-containing protein [Bacteroidota bacterium]